VTGAKNTKECGDGRQVYQDVTNAAVGIQPPAVSHELHHVMDDVRLTSPQTDPRTSLVKKSADPMFSISPIHMPGRKLSDDGCTSFPIHSTQADGTSLNGSSRPAALPPDIPCSPVLKLDEGASKHHQLSETDVISEQCTHSISDIPSVAVELARNLFLGEPSQADRCMSASVTGSCLVRDVIIPSDHVQTACCRESVGATAVENVQQQCSENVCNAVDPVQTESASASRRSDDALQSSFIDRGRTAVVSSSGKSVSPSSNELSPSDRNNRIIGESSHSEDEELTERYDVVEMPCSIAVTQIESGPSSGLDNVVITNPRTVTENSSLSAFWVADSQSGQTRVDPTAGIDCRTSAKNAAVNSLLAQAVPETPSAKRSDNFTNIKSNDGGVSEADEQLSCSSAASARSRKGEKAKASATDNSGVLFGRAGVRRATRGGKHRMYKQTVLMESPKESESPPMSGRKTVDRAKFTGQTDRSSSERASSISSAATCEDSPSENVTRTLRLRTNRRMKQPAAATDVKSKDDDSKQQQKTDVDTCGSQ
jgi:hypothetical protein